jgi:selT/selW/selH-like putative selenoprotein
VFEQYAQALHERFPTLMIVGDNYPPPVLRSAFAQALGILKFILIGLVVTGYNPFPTLNIQTPNIYSWAIENKVYACLMLFFIANAVEGQLVSTGAFEILFNDVPIWSKLETGRIPSPSEMVQMIENNLQYTNNLRYTSKT